MPWTQADADQIRAAIASGELTIRTTDGRSVTYRSIEELRVALSMVEVFLNPPTTPRVRRLQMQSGWD